MAAISRAAPTNSTTAARRTRPARLGGAWTTLVCLRGVPALRPTGAVSGVVDAHITFFDGSLKKVTPSPVACTVSVAGRPLAKVGVRLPSVR